MPDATALRFRAEPLFGWGSAWQLLPQGLISWPHSVTEPGKWPGELQMGLTALLPLPPLRPARGVTSPPLLPVYIPSLSRVPGHADARGGKNLF